MVVGISTEISNVASMISKCTNITDKILVHINQEMDKLNSTQTYSILLHIILLLLTIMKNVLDFNLRDL